MLDYSVIVQLILLSYYRVSNLNLGEMTPDSPRNLLNFRGETSDDPPSARTSGDKLLLEASKLMQIGGVYQ